MQAFSFDAHLAEIGPRVEATLDNLLAPLEPEDDVRPERLVAAMRYAMLGGGKRLRPALLIAVANLFGVDTEKALRAAAAIECIHGYSLVHDDLPSMDDDDLRRGRPTVHRAFDEATAILAGDALQTLAFAVLADPATHESAQVRAELVLTLARASGVAGMAGGQMLDLAAEGRFTDGRPQALGESEIQRLQFMKTGHLIWAAVQMGAQFGQVTYGELMCLAGYARALGAAFQVADDLLDAEGELADVGKATGKDAAAGKATLIGLLGLDGARARLASLTLEALDALSSFGPEADTLRDAARFVAERKA